MKEIDRKTYLLTLNKLRDNGSASIKHIAKNLIEYLRIGKRLAKTKTLSHVLSISPSMISKFVKQCGFNNFNELCFIHNQSIVDQDPKAEFDQLIKDAGELISNCVKILFIGVSGSHISNLDFANKLVRLNKWVLTPASKYDQIGLNNLMTNQDLLIVNSVSLQHEWMIDVIKNTKAKVLLISSFFPDSIKHKINLYWALHHTNDFRGGLRLYSTDSRLKILSFYILVFEYLIEKPENLRLLQLSSYSS